jgi:hypothetical protein
MTLDAVRSPDLVNAAETTTGRRLGAARPQVGTWNPDNFARQQIWGLVRQVFFASVTRPVKQIVVTGVEPATDLSSICRQIGEALALETTKGVVVVVGRGIQNRQGTERKERTRPGIEGSATPLRQVAAQARSNLWMLPQRKILNGGDELGPSLSLCGHLSRLRREFEFSIVEGPPAGESSEAAALGRSADGIILVLEAHRTRRAAARTIIGTLEAADVSVLGTVLSGRRFPIPEGIYRRL